MSVISIWLLSLLVCEMVKCRQGLSRTGNEYGPLQEIPDWSYAGPCMAVLQ